MSDFFSMGGYALFLWPAYAVTLLAIVVNVYTARRDLQSARMEARRRLSAGSPGDPGRGQS
ncbi:MAG: heme exporter protein CcmD [Gammaproteobacteria bacterium]|jgi:heme exporter protein CcmD|nr:heme exporter protein CcmD [Gammaproteobacteria bacterium]